MIPKNHPRYHSCMIREKMAGYALSGVVAMEGLTSHGRGEAFDYLLGEITTPSALRAEQLAGALLLNAKHPVISVNGNTAALAADNIVDLQKASGAIVEVNLFHRTNERVAKIEEILKQAGADVLTGPVERYIDLPHDRGLCHKNGMAEADVILVPLEDGDRAEVLTKEGKIVIAVDLNPLSRTAKTAALPVIDEVTRALTNIARFCKDIKKNELKVDITKINSKEFLEEACNAIIENLKKGGA